MYNIYSELNKMIDFIEDNILEEISVASLAKMIGLNVSMLKNIFTCLTGISIYDYIRYRRLSLAAKDIENKESITNVSYKYLYNSLSSFNRAFKSFHGFSPSEIKRGEKTLKVFNKIVFKEKIKNYNLDYKIYRELEFELYYVSRVISKEKLCEEITKFWQEIKQMYSEFQNKKRIGFLDLANSLEYYCALEHSFKNSKEMLIPKTNYFAYKVRSFKPEYISNSIKIGIDEYIKSLNYNKLNQPDIEIYYDDYVEILIPIT